MIVYVAYYNYGTNSKITVHDTLFGAVTHVQDLVIAHNELVPEKERKNIGVGFAVARYMTDHCEMTYDLVYANSDYPKTIGEGSKHNGKIFGRIDKHEVLEES